MQRSYQEFKDSKIPVSKSRGPFWKARFKMALRLREDQGIKTAWETALEYYNNDQTVHDRFIDKHNVKAKSWRMTENLVFSNTAALVPALYNKNPQVEITYRDDETREPLARCCEKLVNELAAKKHSPGFNLKPKARRMVISATLFNQGWLESGWTFRTESAEGAQQDLIDIAAKMVEASIDEQALLEGQLSALEQKVSFLNPEGPWVKWRHPGDVLHDPFAREEDLSDANWCMIADYLPTSQIQAQYGDDEGKLIFKSTHMLSRKPQDDIDIGKEWDSFNSEKSFSDYGFDNESEYKSHLISKVWYVWDKTTRRIELYQDDDWSWPLWVWDDPLHLDGFFPLTSLNFYYSPTGGETKGEVAYYLDQQDEINWINFLMHKARNNAVNKPYYNSNRADPSVMEKMFNDNYQEPIGVPVPEGERLEDHIPRTNVLNGAEAEALMSKADIYAAVQRLSSVGGAMLGQEYKTNTTNDAVAAYGNAQQNRLDLPLDSIEDAMGDLFWKQIQLALQHMKKEQVVSCVGVTIGAAWPESNMTPEDIRATFTPTIASGSTLKPNSDTKKKMALEIGQVLGQFAKISPVVLVVMLQVFERAFDEIVVEDEDWEMIKQSIMMQIAPPQAPVPGNGGPPGGEEPPPGEAPPEQMPPNDMTQEVINA